MQLERRRPIRRAAAGGVALGALSMVPLAILELVFVLCVRQPEFNPYGDGLWFGLYLFLLLIGVGALLGTLESVISLCVTSFAQHLAKQRLKEPHWIAVLYSLLALPLIALFVALAFGGRRAQLIPGKHFFAAGLGIVGVLGCYWMVRLVVFVRDRLRIRRWGARTATGLALMMGLFAVLFYLADQFVLVRLYWFFHVALTLATIAFFQLATGAIYMGFRPTAKWMGRLADPALAIYIFVVAGVCVVWSLHRVATWEGLRSVYYQHTVVQSKLLQLVSHLGLVQPKRIVFSSGTEPPQTLLRSGPKFRQSNVLLLTIDALRPDHMGTHGYNRQTTPHLDRWAKRAVVFERGYCQIPHTSFSLTSLLTGSYLYSSSRTNPGVHYQTIAEVFRRYGIKTAAFFPPAVFYIDKGDFSGFESTRYGFEYVKYEFMSAKGRVDQILKFLKSKDRGNQFFIWAHFFELHEPYERHHGFDFGDRAMDRYDGELAYVDHHVGRLIGYVKKHHPNTIVALGADHGEAFGEHGSHYHGNSLYEEQVRVPLIVGLPKGSGRRVKGAAQTIDLPVTLAALLDVPVPASMRGRDLGPWMLGEDPQHLQPAFSELRDQKMVVHDGNKLYCHLGRGFCELYDLKQDAAETRNLITAKPTLAKKLRHLLGQWVASHSNQKAHRQRASESELLLSRGKQGDVEAIPGIIKLLDPKKPTEVRRAAAGVLTKMRADKAKRVLIKLHKDKDPAVQDQAKIGAALLGDKFSLAALPSLLSKPDLPPTLRRDGLLALAKSKQSGVAKELCDHLDSMSVSMNDEREEIIVALGDLGDQDAAPCLLRQLTSDVYLRTHLVAVEALGRIHALTGVQPLMQVLKQNRFTSIRAAAAHSLGLIGDRRGIRALRRALQTDLERQVVKESLWALYRLKSLPKMMKFAPKCTKQTACTFGMKFTSQKHYLLLVLKSPYKGTLSVQCGNKALSDLVFAEGMVGVGLVPGTCNDKITLKAQGKEKLHLHRVGVRVL